MNTIDPFVKEGMEAFRDGQDREDCPYEEGTDGQFGWLKGWDRGETNDRNGSEDNQ